jgi:hypothetical protein
MAALWRFIGRMMPEVVFVFAGWGVMAAISTV